MLMVIFFSDGLETSEDIMIFRKMLDASVTNNKSAEAYAKATDNIDVSSKPIFVGFRAMAMMMMCKHAFNPAEKLVFFKKGKSLLEMAIEKERDNVELRYFRFSTQCKLPGILNYDSNLKEDKLFLLIYLKRENRSKSRDSDLFQRIKVFLLKCEQCSKAEKSEIEKLV